MPRMQPNSLTSGNPAPLDPSMLPAGNGFEGIPEIPPPPEIANGSVEGPNEALDDPLGEHEETPEEQGEEGKKGGRLSQRFKELTDKVKAAESEKAELRDRLARLEGMFQGRQQPEAAPEEEAAPEFEVAPFESIHDEQAAELNDRFGKQAEYVQRLVD